MITVGRYLINPDHITAMEAADVDSRIYLVGGQTLLIAGLTPTDILALISAMSVAEATAKAAAAVADKADGKPGDKTSSDKAGGAGANGKDNGDKAKTNGDKAAGDK